MTQRVCTVEGCSRKHEAHGLCRYHYGRAKGYDRRTAVCTECGEDFQQSNHARTTTCPPCSRRLHVERVTAGRAESVVRNWPPGREGKTCPISYGACDYCRGLYIEQSRTKVKRGSTWPKVFCSIHCADTYYATLILYTTRTCADCGERFQARVKSTNPPKVCDACRPARTRRNRKAAKAAGRKRGEPWATMGNHRRRARFYGVAYEPIKRLEVFERDGWRCGICRRKVNAELDFPHPKSASLDHIVPMVHGGDHTRANVQCSHLDCNSEKQAKAENVQLLLIG